MDRRPAVRRSEDGTSSAGRRPARARLGQQSRDAIGVRPAGCEVRGMNIGVLPGPPVPTEPVLPSIGTPAAASVLRPRRGRRMAAAHAAVPTHLAMLPFLRWLAFVVAGNVAAAAHLLAGDSSVPSALTYTVTAASINVGLAALVRQ